MKPSLTLLFLFFITYTFTQAPHENKNDIIKINKVKTLAIHYFINELDSNLTNFDTYDSLGVQLSSKTFSKDRVVINCDTFIYDANHYLVKRINSDGKKIRFVTMLTNNANGQILNSIIRNDSFYVKYINIYDQNGRFIKSVDSSNNGNTMVINNFYNRKGLIAKTVFVNKENGKTVLSNSYNSLGRITARTKVDSKSKFFTEFNYRPNGDCYEIVTTSTFNNRSTVNKVLYTHYSNGLIYERISVWNNKASGLEKIYYTYY